MAILEYLIESICKHTKSNRSSDHATPLSGYGCSHSHFQKKRTLRVRGTAGCEVQTRASHLACVLHHQAHQRNLLDG